MLRILQSWFYRLAELFKFYNSKTKQLPAPVEENITTTEFDVTKKKDLKRCIALWETLVSNKKIEFSLDSLLIWLALWGFAALRFRRTKTDYSFIDLSSIVMEALNNEFPLETVLSSLRKFRAMDEVDLSQDKNLFVLFTHFSGEEVASINRIKKSIIVNKVSEVL